MSINESGDDVDEELDFLELAEGEETSSFSVDFSTCAWNTGVADVV